MWTTRSSATRLSPACRLARTRRSSNGHSLKIWPRSESRRPRCCPARPRTFPRWYRWSSGSAHTTSPTRWRMAAGTSVSRAFLSTASFRRRTSKASRTAPASMSTSTRRMPRATSPFGRPSRPASTACRNPHGIARSVLAGRAGTSSARPWPPSSSATTSTSTPAAKTSCFRIMKTRSPSLNRPPAKPSHGIGCMYVFCWSKAARCRNPRATSTPCATCC